MAKGKGTAPARSAKDEVEAQLARYRAMRDFAVTAEPSGGGKAAWAPPEGLPFVIQKHAATRLHYDFRLGWRGVLKSWACAKGPSYSTHDKRLAVEVEDHPMEYGGFEGAIPKGQYGGGTVLVWDQGTWEPLSGTDFDEGLKEGSLKFTLHGKKLEGRWTLVRMGGKAAHEGKPNWLLIKEHDGRERPASAPAITEEAPNSVVTGRSLEEIAAAEDHVWQSHEVEKAPANHSRLQAKVKAARRAKPASPKPEAAQQNTAQSWFEQAPAAPMPGFIPPQLAAPAERIPPGSGWLHELKVDGYRMQVHLQDGKSTLYTRTGLDWTHRMRPVAGVLAQIKAETAILDGEAVVFDERGGSSFARLQAAFENGGNAQSVAFLAFDLLYLNGRDLRGLPLLARKTLLEPLVNALGSQQVAFSPHLQLEAGEVYAHACELGAEGLITKRADAPYTSGRSENWLKLKCTQRQEFVIGGFTPPSDGGGGIGSLLLGYYRDSKLLHCGRCGTGFTQASARELRRKLETLRTEKMPFTGTLDRFARRDAVWVRPELVCEAQFATWTADDQIRHASFQGLREDKAARDVFKEEVRALPVETREEKAERGEAQNLKLGITPEPAAQPAPAKRSLAKKSALTHPDKVLDPVSGVTKQQIADYYEAVAPAMLPHLAGRPCSIVRCPDGVGKPSFFQKHVKVGLPKSVGSIAVPDHHNPAHSEPYITVDSADALQGLAQLGVLELHPWGSQAAALEQPDRIILDLDPDETLTWNSVVESASQIRAFLRELKLETWVKTTGGKGLHIVAPIEPRAEWPEIRLFARGLAAAVESTDPKRYLIKMTKAARTGRIFLDWMRNERGATAVAPWSPRARPGMRCAVPLRWDELASGPFSFAVANHAEWSERTDPAHDPWAGMKAQPLLPEVLNAVLEQSAALEKQTRRR